MKPTDPIAPLHRLELALPLAAIGLVGGYLAALFFGVNPPLRSGRGDNEVVGWLLVLLTPLTSALLGAVLAPRARGSASRMIGLAIFATILAGLVNGLAIGLGVGALVGMLAGGLIGLFASLPFIPAVTWVLLAARHVGRARAGSVVDDADRRGVWRATGVAIALSATASGALWVSINRFSEPHLPLVAFVGAAAILFVAGALPLDLVAWIHARRAVAALPELAPATLPPISGARGVVDFGVGEGASGVLRVGSYRSTEAVDTLFIGDLRAAHRMLGGTAVRGAIALFVVLIVAVSLRVPV